MLSFFRQRRRFKISQGVGLFQCSAALVYLLSPQSAIYHWIEQTYAFPYMPAITILSLLICGWALAARRQTGWRLYMVLTLPVLVFPLANSWYILINITGTLLAAWLLFGFWVVLQVLHAQEEQIEYLSRIGVHIGRGN